MTRFKLQRTSDGQQFYFEEQADGNHETLTTSETYKRKGDAIKAISLLADDNDEIIDDTYRHPKRKWKKP